MVRSKLGSIALVAAVFIAAACGDDDDGQGASTGSSGALGSLSAALEQVPAIDLDPGTTISWGDIDAANEALGITRPEPTAELDELNGWTMSLNGNVEGAVLVPLPALVVGGGIDVDAYADELGWSLVDVERFVEIDSPPYRFFLATGGVNVDGDGVEPFGDDLHTAGDGDDLQVDLEQRSPVRPTGMPLRLALEDGVLAASSTTELVEAWRDGDGGSLLDDEGYAAVAGTLDDIGVVAAMVFPHQEADVAWDADVVGMGWWADDGAPRVTLVFHLLDPAGAERAADELGRVLRDGTTMRGEPLSDLLEVVEVRADDGLVVATVEPERRQTVLQQFMARDVPFVPAPS